jgi:1,4-alpha-glucan branching enzyme
MRDFLRCVTDLVQLRRTQPALRGSNARVSRAAHYERVLVLHRWLEQGQDVIVAASLDERPKQGYAVGLPYTGEWREIFNSDAYDTRSAVGNGGKVLASGPSLDGFATSAALTLPANGVIVLVKQQT